MRLDDARGVREARGVQDAPAQGLVVLAGLGHVVGQGGGLHEHHVHGPAPGLSQGLGQGQGHAGHGIALANVRDRLRLLHDLQGGFRTALVDDVYQARIEVPLPARGER